MHEGIPILNFLVPKEFTHENGKLTGVMFEKVKAEYDDKGPPQPGADRRAGRACALRRRAGRGRPGECLPLDRARHRHRVRQMGHAQGRSEDHARRPIRRCSSAATARSARRTSSGRWRTATRPRFPSTRCSAARTSTDRPLPAVELMSQKMGIHEWSYDNEIALDQRYKVPHRDKAIALKDIKAEVELGFDPQAGAGRGRPLPELRRADGVHVLALHRMRRLRRYLPDGLHHLHRERRGSRAAHAAAGAGEQPDAGPLCRRTS